jgi:predicted GNAT family acetyltransferase
VTTEVRRGEDRYEILVDGEVAGTLTTTMLDGRLVLDLTRVHEEFAGQGLASQLAQWALDDARAQGLRVLPMCPYVSKWLTTHPEYQDLVDAEMLAAIEAGG